MNKVMLIGNLTRDPESSTTPNGVNICKFGIAINRSFGEEKAVDYFNIVAWRGQADNCSKYLKKGSKVCVIGSLQNNDYIGNDGIKRHNVIINASEVEFLSSKSAQTVESDAAEKAIPKTQYKQTVINSTSNVSASTDDLMPF